MPLDIYDLPENLVGFKVSFAKTGRVFWRSSEDKTCEISNLSNEEFEERFSYAIVKNQFFEKIEFDDMKTKIYFAERYGGLGVATNGGGVRCGNSGKTQIKGVGRNILGLQTKDHWHSYGGLNLIDAAYEAIIAETIGKLLPIGVAKIYGIIILENNAALLPGPPEDDLESKRSYGALLIRDATIRPAHFLRCPGFEPASDSNDMPPDVARTKMSNKRFYKKFNQKNEFISYIGMCLSRHANQFAFARAARIFHGSLSPSNVCLDGRWIDLSNTTFIGGRHNPKAYTSFYAEADSLINYMEELVYTTSKFNSVKIDFSILKKYYVGQFREYFKIHVGYVLGLDYTKLENSDKPDVDTIAAYIFERFSGASETTYERAFSIERDDPAIKIIENFYLSPLEEKNHPEDETETDSVKSSFVRVLHKCKPSNCNIRFFKIYSFILSMKRCILSEFFYMGRLEGRLYDLVSNRRENELAVFINESIDLGEWIFSNERDIQKNLIIAKTDDFQLTFSVDVGAYEINQKSNGTLTFSTFNDALTHIQKRKYQLIVNGYSVKKYLDIISCTLTQLEH